MRLYVDTSVLAAYYTPEPLSAEAEGVLCAWPAPAVSDLVEVELFSALARKVRLGEMEPAAAERVRALFLSHLEAGLYRRLPLERAHYRLARELLAGLSLPLRTLDALHLAAASLCGRVLATADRPLARAARAAGMEPLLVEPGSTTTVHEGRG